ncbi:nucleoside recognition domain-containing protein, partial [Fibrobacterota bacterium]
MDTPQKSRVIRVLEVTVLLLAAWLLFKTAFFLGTHPTRLIGSLFQLMTNLVWTQVSHVDFRNFLVFGFLAGLGGFVVYLPNIMILFFFSHVLKDSGLINRAAGMVHPLFKRFGLSGSSFQPMLFGFGCTVATIHSSRNIGDRRTRYLTLLVTPFLSCGAKFGVYILLISALFTPGEAGTVLFILYFLGIAFSLLSASILNRFMAGDRAQGDVPEKEPLRFPGLLRTGLDTLKDGWIFLKTAGSVIVMASIIIWALSYWPGISAKDYQTLREYAHESGQAIPSRSTLSIHHSYAAGLGRFVEP